MPGQAVALFPDLGAASPLRAATPMGPDSSGGPAPPCTVSLSSLLSKDCPPGRPFGQNWRILHDWPHVTTVHATQKHSGIKCAKKMRSDNQVSIDSRRAWALEAFTA